MLFIVITRKALTPASSQMAPETPRSSLSSAFWWLWQSEGLTRSSECKASSPQGFMGEKNERKKTIKWNMVCVCWSILTVQENRVTETTFSQNYHHISRQPQSINTLFRNKDTRLCWTDVWDGQFTVCKTLGG